MEGRERAQISILHYFLFGEEKVDKYRPGLMIFPKCPPWNTTQKPPSLWSIRARRPTLLPLLPPPRYGNFLSTGTHAQVPREGSVWKSFPRPTDRPFPPLIHSTVKMRAKTCCREEEKEKVRRYGKEGEEDEGRNEGPGIRWE